MMTTSRHLNRLKSIVRDQVPLGWQVPLKYWYSWLRGSLEVEMSILKHLFCKGSCVIDVGGNRGVYAYRLWKLGAHVEVFEPNPACLRVLESWAEGKNHVHVHGVALSNRAGEASLHIPVDQAGVEHDASASIEHTGFDHARDQPVRLASLDSFGFKKVALIKIDVEGHEYSVIEGAAHLLKDSKPALLVEIEQRHSGRPIAEVFAVILGYGYDGFFMRGPRLVPLSEFDVARDQAAENLGGYGGHYINNFFFFHRDRLADGEYCGWQSHPITMKGCSNCRRAIGAAPLRELH